MNKFQQRIGKNGKTELFTNCSVCKKELLPHQTSPFSKKGLCKDCEKKK